MWVPAIVTNEVLAFVRDVLREFGQKIQCAENLEVAPRAAFQIAAGRTGETAAVRLVESWGNLHGLLKQPIKQLTA